MFEFLQSTLDGLLEAGPYALIGLGLTISFGVLQRINLAFGATALLSAYVGSWLHVNWSVPALGVWVAVVATTLVAGFYVQWMCFQHSTNSSSNKHQQSEALSTLNLKEATALTASFALWMQLEQIAVNFQPNHLHPFPDFASYTNFQFIDLSIRPDRVYIFLVAIGLIWFLSKWLKYSQIGLGIRAVSSNQVAANLCGMNISQIQHIGTALSSVLCGVASCAVLSMDGQVTPMFGMWVLFKGLTCAVLGGFGSVQGVLSGAILLGLTEAYAQVLWGSTGRDAATWGLLLLAILMQAGNFEGARKLIHGDLHE